MVNLKKIAQGFVIESSAKRLKGEMILLLVLLHMWNKTQSSVNPLFGYGESCTKFDELPQPMPLESALVVAEDHKFVFEEVILPGLCGVLVITARIW